MGTHRGNSAPRHRRWLCPVPAGGPRGAGTSELTSWTRVVWQFLRSGPCSSTLGAPGCNKSIMLGPGGDPLRPPAPLPRPGPCVVPGLHPPARPPPRAHRGPVDEPVRLFLAVDDDAVAPAPLLGCPARAEAAGRRWHPGLLHPGRSPGRSAAGRARTHRSCSRACITTKSHVWLIRLCRRL